MSWKKLTTILPLIAACSDYSIERNDDAAGIIEWDTEDPPPDGVPPPPEGTTTGDDVRECWRMSAEPAEVEIDESCQAENTLGDFQVTVEWERPDFGAYGETSQVLMAPAVGQLTDDNGDGEINAEDTPDIVVVADDGDSYFSLSGVLFVVSGDNNSDQQSYFNGAVLEVDPESESDVQRAEDGVVYPIEQIGDLSEDASYWEWYIYRYSNVALGDLDNDGSPEIVGIVQGREYMPSVDAPPDSGPLDTVLPGSEDDSGDSAGEPPVDTDDDPVRDEKPSDEDICYLGVLGSDLSFLWANTEVMFECGGHAPALADLEGDGDVEIVVGPYIFDGVTGELQAQGGAGNGSYPAYAEIGYISFPIDLDGDGAQEIVAGTALYSPDGATICTVPEGQPDGFPAAADMDLDGDGEFIVVGGGTVAIYEHDCSLTASWDVEGGGTGGPPTIADFDGDTYPEIGVAGANRYAVYDGDGTVLWSVVTTDESSHATGSTVFDFDGNGRAEVLYADEVALWVLDGLTGTTLLYDTEHTSRTLHDFPVVVDADNDGQAEILVPNGGGHYGSERTGMYALGSADGSWVAARQVWNQHAYSITNINDDLTIPSPGVSNWPDYNTFRSGTIDPVTYWALPDPTPELLDICNEECDAGWALILIRLANVGVANLDVNIPISIYAEPPSGDRTLIETLWVDPVASGLTSSGIQVQLMKEDMPDMRVVVAANDDGESTWISDDCSLSNNEFRIDDGLCPN